MNIGEAVECSPLRIDAGQSMCDVFAACRAGLATSVDSDGQALVDDLDEFSYMDFQFDSSSPSGRSEPSVEVTRGGIAAVHSLLPDLEARAAQMDAELKGEFAW